MAYSHGIRTGFSNRLMSVVQAKLSQIYYGLLNLEKLTE